MILSKVDFPLPMFPSKDIINGFNIFQIVFLIDKINIIFKSYV